MKANGDRTRATVSGLKKGQLVHIKKKMEQSSHRKSKSNRIKWAGPFMLGMTLENSPVHSITNCLARKSGTDDFYVMKILNLQDDTVDDQQGCVLIHTEYTLLSFLEGEPGIVQQHGLFRDEAKDANGKIVTRLSLVLDCYVPHDFSPKYSQFTNLQHHIVDVKRMTETDAIKMLIEILLIVQRLHNKNVVHRDLKLANVIMNKATGEISLANFCLGKRLSKDTDLLCDQRGSPAFISPDVISGQPYNGKCTDMWAIGIMFYTMLFGQFPFYDPCSDDLFKKIITCDYKIPDPGSVSPKSLEIIESLIVADPNMRLTCDKLLDKLYVPTSIEQPLQVVPEPPPELRHNQSKDDLVSGKTVRLPVTRIFEEAKVLTYRDLKKIYIGYQTRDFNIRNLINRL